MRRNYDDKQIEQLLTQLPRIKDQQRQEELFASISSKLADEQEQVAEDDGKKFNRKRFPYLIPSLASIAAILIIAIIAPSMFFNKEDAADSTSGKDNHTDTEMMPMALEIQDEDIVKIAESDIPKMEREVSLPDVQSHVIQELPEKSQLVVAAVPEPNAQYVVPISFIAPNIETGPISYLNEIDHSLYEEEWGLAEYLLEHVTFAQKDEVTVIVDVPENHTFHQGSAMETLFIRSLHEMLQPLGYEQIEFMTAGEAGIELGNYGMLETIPIKEHQVSAYYLFQLDEQYETFLVPVPTEASNIVEAIQQMNTTSEGDEFLNAPIPKGIEIASVVEDKENSTVIITFAENAIIEQNEEHLLMIEALLLTAKAFGFEMVQFEATDITEIGDYNLTAPIAVPIAPNPMPYIHER